MNTPTETTPPAGSRIATSIAGADFHDAWAIDAADPTLSALGWLYMLPVRPMHKLIAPAVLRHIGRA